jgi:hypothetical protein
MRSGSKVRWKFESITSYFFFVSMTLGPVRKIGPKIPWAEIHVPLQLLSRGKKQILAESDGSCWILMNPIGFWWVLLGLVKKCLTWPYPYYLRVYEFIVDILLSYMTKDKESYFLLLDMRYSFLCFSNKTFFSYKRKDINRKIFLFLILIWFEIIRRMKTVFSLTSTILMSFWSSKRKIEIWFLIYF